LSTNVSKLIIDSAENKTEIVKSGTVTDKNDDGEICDKPAKQKKLNNQKPSKKRKQTSENCKKSRKVSAENNLSLNAVRVIIDSPDTKTDLCRNCNVTYENDDGTLSAKPAKRKN